MCSTTEKKRKYIRSINPFHTFEPSRYTDLCFVAAKSFIVANHEFQKLPLSYLLNLYCARC